MGSKKASEIELTTLEVRGMAALWRQDYGGEACGEKELKRRSGGDSLVILCK
jgi:hypothetical protein